MLKDTKSGASSTKGKKEALPDTGKTKQSIGGKTQFNVLTGYQIDRSHAEALRMEAVKKNFKKFYELTPYDYKPFVHSFYNYYRAEQHIIDQHKKLVESGEMNADAAKKVIKAKMKALKEMVIEQISEARKDNWTKMAQNAGIDVEQKRSEEAIKNLQALGKKYSSIVQNTPKPKVPSTGFNEEVWDEKNPKEKSSKLTPAQKAKAKARASKAGRPYPNLVDNMWAANEEYGAGFWGTDTLTQNLKSATPGEKGKKRKPTSEEVVAEAGQFSYGKPPRKGTVAYNAFMMRKKQEKDQKPIEPKDQMVGTAKVTKEETVDEAYYEKARADQKMVKVRVPSKTGGYRYVWRRQKQPLHTSISKQDMQVESVTLNEEDLDKIKKVFYLAQRGMVKQSELGNFRLIVKKFLQNKTLTMNEKDYLLKKYQDLLDFILKDDSLTQRFWSVLSTKGFK